ncbi:MAG: hypothetical protein UX34_C0003G0004 [Candidatus Woesebacteria bacterium GW2011_GWF1_46_13]|uniref:Uncharacterized protein n=1 Tax=Candidatus Woesebacteria bacterium GW2011_GWF1_46_13 TaxID=1618602 RepID=A0A0G1NWK2_9BACT|nr:MAG: hypothetical protein UX34_C0003G0004 [Candidatus Woesebacteria bacterium GW2011_GWF1_46_13]
MLYCIVIYLTEKVLSDREGRDRPDRLSRVGILSAAELYRHGAIDKICITVEPQLSNPQVRRLKILLNNPPEEDIVVDAKTVTTGEEIRTFRKLAEENKWNSLITIGNHAHLPRIKREIKKTFKNDGVEARSSREILSRYPRYSSILSETEDWPEQRSLALQERILKLPILGSLVLKMAPHLSRLKVSLQTWGFRQIENKKF